MGRIVTKLIVFSLMFLFVMTTHVSANDERYINSGDTHTSTLYEKDEHWYQFTTTEDNGDMYIYLSNTTAPVQFSIYDSNKSYISSYNTTYFTTRKAGTYYIKVTPGYWSSSYSSGSYDLTATYADGKRKHNEATMEPNDTRENAYKLNSGSKISSTLSSNNDIDFYEITTTKDNGDVYIYLSNTTAPARFTVYDSNKKRLGSYSTSYFNMLKAGTYYIEVNPSSWGSKYSNGKYDLITTFSTPTINHNSSTFEPNDTRENSFALSSGKSVKSTLSNNLDKDFYSITLNKEGYVNVELSGTSGPARFNIYDGNKKRLSSTNTTYAKQLKAGTYYIEVSPYSWGNSYSSGNYTLKASFPNNSVVKNKILLTLNSKNVKVNGANKKLLAAPYIKQATTLVPIRLISEQLGAEVQWKASDQSIKIVLDGTTINLNIGFQYVYVNGKRELLRIAPELKNGTTFVPVRFISEQYGRYVEWNSKNQQITIN